MPLSRRHFLASAALTGAALSARAEEKKYKAAVIGDTKQGGYGHDLHMIFEHRPDVDIVALADPDETGRAERAAQCGANTTYADYREMLEKESPDIVVVGPRWTVNHKEYVLACAEAGCHGFLEKPLCVDLAEADAMIEATESRGLKWGLAYNFRMTPNVAHVKKLLDDGLLGTIMEVRGHGKEDQRAGGEDLIVLGTHSFDLMCYLLGGAPQWCMADITHNGKPATPADVREATEPLGPIVGNRLNAVYGFDQGVTGHFSSMRTKEGPGARWAVNVYGSKGVITINLGREVPVIHYLDDSVWHAGARGTEWVVPEGMPDYSYEGSVGRYIPNVTDLMDAIENDRPVSAGLRHGRQSQEMIHGVWASHIAGCKVALPLEERGHPLRAWTA